MASTFNTKIVGRRNFDGLQITYVRGDATNEKLLDTTLIYRASGYLVVRRGQARHGRPSPPADKVDKVECGEPQYPAAVRRAAVRLARAERAADGRVVPADADPRPALVQSNPATVVAT
jgi:hypothetical protein